ncbi:MAG: purine-binding chemotaxis protein CheW [Nitrospiraceae bacterium]|nr:MAG: purine-binding chemotaxis protein CheW [Nitrospiraceae bacterium]
MLNNKNSGTESIIEMMQYLTFKLDEEVFAIDISKVREVLEFSPVTKVPQTPNFMCGVINLRGSVVPVVDLRLKFGMEEAAKTVDTCIIISEVTLDGETTIIGSLVDSVQEVFEFESSQIEPAPRIGTKLKIEFIKGMGKRDDEFIIILDIDRVFSTDEFSLIQQTEAFATERKHIKETAYSTPESTGS